MTNKIKLYPHPVLKSRFNWSAFKCIGAISASSDVDFVSTLLPHLPFIILVCMCFLS